MRLRYSLALILALTCSSRSFAASRLDYTVDLRETSKHLVHITLKPVKLGQSVVTFQMPVWAPGAYSVTHYGHYVSNFTALDHSGNSLEVKQLNADRWEIEQAKDLSTITYDILDSHKDTTSLYFGMAHFDSTILFANATCFFGYLNDKKNVSATVTYLKPDNWQIATALDPTTIVGIPQQTGEFHHTTFSAKDYDVLADAPVMAAPQFQARTFVEGSASYDLVMLSNKPLPMDSLTPYVKKIVHAETEFFHDTPFKHYTFLIYAPTFSRVPSMAEGALEHANSSDYLLMNMPWFAFKGFTLPIVSHEFFHLWNVKRIHSSLLGPFDYTSRVMTTSLWLSEGITDYYAHTLLTRAHIVPVGNFFDDIQTWMHGLDAHDNSKPQSLEQLSIAESDFHLDDAGMFYIKGPLVGLMLDIEIRRKSNNKKSLDDVMFALNADAKKGVTFKDPDLIHKMEHIAGVDLTDFYKRYIAGTDTLPINLYLSYIGVLPNAGNAEDNKLNLNFSSNGGVIISSLDTGSTLGQAGIKKGDEITSINGTKISMSNLDSFSALQDASNVKLEIIRDGTPMTLNADLQAARAKSALYKYHPYSIDPKSTQLQIAMRKGIMEQL
jgi:predicted metalloprotease with PDZ domain